MFRHTLGHPPLPWETAPSLLPSLQALGLHQAQQQLLLHPGVVLGEHTSTLHQVQDTHTLPEGARTGCSAKHVRLVRRPEGKEHLLPAIPVAGRGQVEDSAQ
jgi:hypothetical protein